MVRADAVGALLDIATEFAPRTKFPQLNNWKRCSEDALWNHFVYQVATVGGSSAVDRLKASRALQQALRFRALRESNSTARRSTIYKSLRAAAVRYSGKSIEKCRKTRAIDRNFEYLNSLGGPGAYLNLVSVLSTEPERIDHVAEHFRYIKLKGARDLLAELGLATDIIAFDTRLLKILKALNVDVPDDVRTNRRLYKKFQDELITKVCGPACIAGVMLDRILYQNYRAIIAKIGGVRTSESATGAPRCRPSCPA
jgi:hypothetical protein